MSRLPLTNAANMERVLFHLGFVKTRQKGSHAFYRHPDGRCTTIPHHGTKDLARPLIREIIRDIEITPDEYTSLLQGL